MNKLALRLLYRDARSGELRLLVLALVLAVAAVTAVAFFSDRLRQALEVEAHQLLGADLVLRADHPLPQSYRDEASRRGLQQVESVSFPSMVMSAQGFRLVDVKAVEAGYPLRGHLRLADVADAPGQVHRGAPARGAAWMEPRLGAELGLHPGDAVQLGDLELTLAAYLTLEPDRSVNFMGLAPRLMVNLADLPDTGLLQHGARVSYRLLLAGERQQVRDFVDWLQPRLGRGEKLEEGSRQEVRTAMDRARRFLGLASLLTVVLAAVAMSMAVRRYIQRHLDACALMRCLGASRAEVLRLYLGQFLLLGLGATGLGLLLGYGVHLGLYEILAGLLRSDLPRPGILPVLQGLALGLVLLLGFALPPLLRLQRVSPLRVMRRDLGLPSLGQGLAYAAGLAVLAGLIFWMAEDPFLGGITLLVFAVAMLIFLLLARLLVALLGRWRRAGMAFGWRFGLASLSRHAWASSLQILALSLGFMALLLLTVIRAELLGAWQASMPVDAPNRFVINIQPDQQAELAAQLRQAGLQPEMAPMVRGRLSAIGTRPVQASDYPEDERAQRLVEREFNLSWRADLPPGNRIEAGAWFPPGSEGVPLASVEAGLARTLGIALGDKLSFNISGRPVTVEVSNLRGLNWDSMRINFFVLVPPGVLEEMPASYLANFYLPEGQVGVLAEVLARFPNLTVIDIAALLAQLREVIGQVSLAVQLVFLLTLAAGLLVLHGALVSAFDERRQSLAILRALGASQAQLRLGLRVELAAIGGLAGFLAALGALAAGQVLAWRLFDLLITPAWWLIPVASLLGALLTVLAGSLSLNRLLAARPLEALRAA